MLIINKNVRFSIKLSRLGYVCSILVLQSLVYWIFFVAFSQNRTIITAVCASLAATIVCHAKAGLVVPRRCFALRSRGSCRVSKQPQLAGRKEQAKRDLSQMLPQDPECHLFKGNRVPHCQQRTISILVVQDHLTPSPRRNCIWPLSFQSCSFVLINEQMINNNPYG